MAEYTASLLTKSPQGLPGCHEPPNGYVYGRVGEVHRSVGDHGGTVWLKLSDDTLNVGWVKVAGGYVPPPPSPTPTPTVTITPTMTPTVTPTPTLTPTYTPTPTITPTMTQTPGASPTPTPTMTQTPGASPTPTPTMTLTPSSMKFGGIYRTWYNSSDCTGVSFYQDISSTCALYYNHSEGGSTMYPDVPGYPDHLPTTDPVWSCRMSASLYVEATDTYYFSATADDSADVYIDGTLRFTVGSNTASTQSLSAGWHPFEVRYSNIACCQSYLSLQWKRSTAGGYHEMNEFSNPFGPIYPFSVNSPATPNGIVSSYGWGIYSSNTVVDVGIVMDPEWTFVSWSGAESIGIESGYDMFSNPIKIRTYEPGVNGCSITAATRYVGAVSPTPTPTVTPSSTHTVTCQSVSLYSDSITGNFAFKWTSCVGSHETVGPGSTYPSVHQRIVSAVCIEESSLNVISGYAEYGATCS